MLNAKVTNNNEGYAERERWHKTITDDICKYHHHKDVLRITTSQGEHVRGIHIWDNESKKYS